MTGSLGLADADATLFGSTYLAELGMVAAGAGDVDGDGLDDLLVGSPKDDSAGTDAGAVLVVTSVAGAGAVDAATIATAEKLVGGNPGDLAEPASRSPAIATATGATSWRSALRRSWVKPFGVRPGWRGW